MRIYSIRPLFLQRVSTILLLLFLSTIFFISCQKNADKQEEAQNTEAVNKVIAWLEEQKSTATLAGSKKIKSLKENLDFSLTGTGLFSPDETLIIVPIKNSFVTNSNQDKHPINSLVLLVNNKKKIRRGYIVQYISPKEINSKDLSKFFYSYYNLETTDFTGSLAYLTVSDEFSYETNYTNGKMSYYTERR